MECVIVAVSVALPLPVTVTVWGVFQLALVKVRSPDTVAWVASLVAGRTVTLPPGWLLSASV